MEANWIEKQELAPAQQGKLATTRCERRGRDCGEGPGVDTHATRMEEMEPPWRDEQ
jgi:hypothetical protein